MYIVYSNIYIFVYVYGILFAHASPAAYSMHPAPW